MNQRTAIDHNEIKQTLEDHGFSIADSIGAGGFAHVFKVWSQKYNQFFAIKAFDMRGRAMTHNVSSYSAEINSLKKLSHPNIVKIYDHFSDASFLFIVLEYCPNGNLSNHITDGVPLGEDTIKAVCLDLIHALDYCHKNSIAHRDVKPENVLIDKYCQAKLADFGLSQTIDSNGRLYRFGGSRPFLSPEILKKESFDPFKADVWALGVVFFLMATGFVPNLVDDHGNCQTLFLPDYINDDLVDVIKIMLNTDPQRRPTMDEISRMPYFTKIGSSRQLNRNALKLKIHCEIRSRTISPTAFMVQNKANRPLVHNRSLTIMNSKSKRRPLSNKRLKTAGPTFK